MEDDVSRQQDLSPGYNKEAFRCPQCGVYAKQHWNSLYRKRFELIFDMKQAYDHENQDRINGAHISECDHCHGISFWLDKNLIYPRVLTAPAAHENMPKGALRFYNEARQISIDSPAAAAAFLRVVAAEICRHHDEKDEEVQDLNEAIGNLSRNGLPSEVIQSLDLVRLFGNKGAHKGRIDLTGEDDKYVVDRLFKLINFIVEKTIAEPMKIEELTDSLSEGQRRQIRERDKKDSNE